MPRRTKPLDPPQRALALADAMRLLALNIPGAAADVPSATAGILEPGALFQITMPDGAIYRVRVNRTA